ncbi:MAG: ECF-type sigma factor [Phycisphaerales bacterium]
MDGSESAASPPTGAPPPGLSEAIYTRLRLLARSQMASEPKGVTLQPTALVHEVYLRLLKDPGLSWADDRQFFAAAGECMRRILVDEARRRRAIKRGGGRARVVLPEIPDQQRIDPHDTEGSVLGLDRALAGLRDIDDRLYEVVILRYFAGLSVANTASLMGIAPRTVKRDWVAARSWLHARISASAAGNQP